MAAGAYRDARAGVAALVVPGPVVEPDPVRHEVYERVRARYDAVYRHLDPAFHDANRDWPAEPVEEVAIADSM